MPRINIDDDVETRPEFWKLLPLCDHNRDVALGQLIRVSRLCQRAFVAGTTVSKRELIASGLGSMITAGWVKKSGHGYMIIDAERQFSWLVASRQNGKRGGRPRREKPMGIPRDTYAVPMGHPPKPSASPSPSPSTSISISKEEEGFEGIISDDPFVMKFLNDVSPEAQRAWLKLYKDRIWLGSELKKAAAYWISKGNRSSDGSPKVIFIYRWLTRATERTKPNGSENQQPPAMQEKTLVSKIIEITDPDTGGKTYMLDPNQPTAY